MSNETPWVEAFVRALPHVQQVIAIIHGDASLPPPYRVRLAAPAEGRP